MLSTDLVYDVCVGWESVEDLPQGSDVEEPGERWHNHFFFLPALTFKRSRYPKKKEQQKKKKQAREQRAESSAVTYWKLTSVSWRLVFVKSP